MTGIKAAIAAEETEKREASERARTRQVTDLKRTNAKLFDENAQLRQLLDRYSTIKPVDQKVPAWLKRKQATKKHHDTPVLMLSDLHLDEVVDLHEMDGINEYDRTIAHRRLENVVDGTVTLLKRHTAGTHHDGIVVALLGDIITGEIHDELARTNVAPPSASIVHWVPHLASALRYLADEFGRVFVPCVDGNHDRFYKKTPAKKRAESSLAWVVYNWLADSLRDDARVTFGISTSPEQLIDVYGSTFLLSHGDGFRSQGGVGGLYPSMLKWLLRKHQLYSATKRDFNYALIGHHHQDLWGQDFVVNAALKGYDEYAKSNGFTFGVAAQQLFTVTPERGIGHRLTVHAD